VSATLLVTADPGFESQVKRAFDGDLDAERWWDPMLPRLHPQQAVESMVSGGTAVAVLGPGVPVPAALELAAALDVLHPEVCVVLVAKPTAKLWEQALRAGVREILSPGAGDEEVFQSLSRAGAAAARRQASAGARQRQEEMPRGRVITVLSPKGGAGKTTVASNLVVHLGREAPGRVVIVDLDMQFGDVASALAVGPQSTMADAARVAGKLDSTALKVFLEPHPGGFYVLAAPHFPAEAEEVGAATVGHVLDLLAADFDYVVVDTAAGLDEHALAAADRSDDLVLVCVTDVPTVRGLRKAVDAIDMLGMTRQRRHLVLNRADDRVGLSARDVEATLGLGVDAAVPTSRSVPISMNQGSPLVESDPRSPVARSLTQFAQRLIQAVPGAPPAATASAGAPHGGRRFSRKDGR
jgi:pilus assembly protein CpaE